MKKHYNYIVIGSGPSAVHAAQTIAEAGEHVTILDVGIKNETYENSVPDKNYSLIRETCNEQQTFFLGKNFEAFHFNNIKTGVQLTPPRMHLISDAEKYIPLSSNTFCPLESLAYGGLSSSWGLGCYVYSDNELQMAGLNPEAFHGAYDVIASRIGISCGKDDTAPYTTSYLNNILPPLSYDNSIKLLFENYLKKRAKLNAQGIFLGNAPLALLSEDYKGRRKTAYNDMDFYTDDGLSAYRSWMTIDELKKNPKFEYLDKRMVLSFSENSEHVCIKLLHTDTQEISEVTCNKLLLTAGALGNARIVMRSLKDKVKRLPLLCNPYSYIIGINAQMLGTPLSRLKTSLAQGVIIYDKNNLHQDITSVALYTYRSQMLFKIIKEVPFDFADSRKLIKYLQSAFIIAGVHHPDEYSEQKFLELHENNKYITGDIMFAHYNLNLKERKKIRDNEKIIRKTLRSIGCYPLKTIDPGYGSSIHYAGTLPFSEKDLPGTTSKNGLLHQFNRIYTADSSAFLFLPAKGITFTLMANAHLVAKNALKH